MRAVICSIILLVLLGTSALADTPPPGTVKAKTFSGDGVTAITATGGALNVNVSNASGLTTVNQGSAGVQSWLVDGSGHTQPVSGTFWQTTQPVSGTLTCNAGSGTLAVSGPLTDAQLRATAVPVSGTVTTSSTSNGNTGSAVPAQATQIGGSDGTNLRAVKVSTTGVVSVDGSASTQPVSAALLPLPTGAATDAGLVAIDSTLGSPFQAGGSIGNSSFGISGTLPAFASTPTFNLGTLNGAATAANQATLITNLGSPFQAGGSIGNSSFGISGTLPAFGATPTFNLGTLNGAATAANQSTGNSSLATIATNTGNIPAQGQALAAGSLPVVLTAAQVTTLTPLATVTVTQATGTNLHTVVDSAPTTAVTQSGTWNVNAKPATPTALTVRQAAVTIGTSAVRLTTDGLAAAATRVLLVAQLLTTSTANCYFGSSSVTSSSTGRGVQMFAGQPFSFSNDAGDYYAICDTSSQTFLITEQE